MTPTAEQTHNALIDLMNILADDLHLSDDTRQDILTMIPAMVTSRPTKPAQKWGVGLPPVGTECEYAAQPEDTVYSFMPEWNDGDRLEVLAHMQGEARPVAVVWNKRTKQATGLVVKASRPIQSQADRDREASITRIQTASQGKMGPPISAKQATNLYEAGFRAPEEKS